MPFKNITAPRRVADLGAEVKSSAFLATPGLYAALTNDPVRLAVQPVSGGNTRVTNVSIDAAEEVAFITRDVVVVRAGDDSVWALIDITHTPKMEQVARDVRALCMRPTGESALALGWDGSATALTLAQHEVAARPFPLRGTLRAADVLVSETVVVVDAGGEGGELRIHPGATPEPGASARAALPREAAKLDRVRGGKDLSAVYRKGSSAVCAVTRGAGKLTAKMIDLGAPVTDVGVFETSLFATFSDGRVALFDADAIARADGSAAEPTATVAIGGRGEPRTVLIAGRGSPAVFVGTSAGEVIQAQAMRKTPV